MKKIGLYLVMIVALSSCVTKKKFVFMQSALRTELDVMGHDWKSFSGTAWSVNASSRDTALVDALIGELERTYCIDGSTTLFVAEQAGATYCWQNTATATWENVGSAGFSADQADFQSLAFDGSIENLSNDELRNFLDK